MSDLIVRTVAAGATVLGYAALCGSIYRRERRRQAAEAKTADDLRGDGSQAPVLVLFASQTGQAETIARQTARRLHADGTPCRVLALDALDMPTLRSTAQALFIASTYGEGDAPDGASSFSSEHMLTHAALPHLRYALLALGDRQYANFCGFGRALDQWLSASGAQPMIPRTELDNGDPVLLAQWLGRWGGDASEQQAVIEAPFSPWRLEGRRRLNDGSVGAPVFLLRLRPAHAEAALPAWQSGDLAQIAIPGEPERPRDYSVASIPADGALELIVRQEGHADGTLGAASGLLTCMPLSDTLSLRLRPHRNFRLDDNAQRPLILIGNGSGLAGLRSHLRARQTSGERENWLVFGERNAAHDFLCRDEIEAWQRDGLLQRVDMAFSRDQPERVYVQHRLLQASDQVRAWVARGAAIYVCGSLQGMAGSVDAALRQVIGDAAMRALSAEGRYRRDVY